MPLDGAIVGSNLRLILIVGDPVTAGNQQNIITAAGDGKSLAGLFSALTTNVPMLENPGGTLDIQRAAVGTTGIPAIDTEGTKATYSSGIIDYTPYAVATDFWNLVGSATKTVRVRRVSISGIATAATSIAIQLIKRTAVNTGGTTAQPAIAQHDSNDGAPTAAVNTYSVIPSGLGAGVTVRSAKLNLGAAGAAGSVVWDFSTRNGRGIVLRGIAQCLSLNWNGATVPSGTLLCVDTEFTEES